MEERFHWQDLWTNLASKVETERAWALKTKGFVGVAGFGERSSFLEVRKMGGRSGGVDLMCSGSEATQRKAARRKSAHSVKGAPQVYNVQDRPRRRPRSTHQRENSIRIVSPLPKGLLFGRLWI